MFWTKAYETGIIQNYLNFSVYYCLYNFVAVSANYVDVYGTIIIVVYKYR